MSNIKKALIMTALFLPATIVCMERRDPEWERTWGMKTAAVRGRKAAILKCTNMPFARSQAKLTEEKIAADMEKKGWTAETLSQAAQKSRDEGNAIQAGRYRRMADILAKK